MFGIDSRPTAFAEVLGQDPAVTILKKILELGNLPNSIVLGAPRGVGKTTLARIFAKSVLCENRDVRTGESCGACSSCLSMADGVNVSYREIDSVNNASKESISELLSSLNFAFDERAVVVFDEAHRLSAAAKDSLLVALENPNTSKHLLVIFCTTDKASLPPALLSRSLDVRMLHPSDESILAKLSSICDKKQIKYEIDALRMLCSTSGNHFRDAENQMYSVFITKGEVTVEGVEFVIGSPRRLLSNILADIPKDLEAALTHAKEYEGLFNKEVNQQETLSLLTDAYLKQALGKEVDVFASKVAAAHRGRLSVLVKYVLDNALFTTSRCFFTDIIALSNVAATSSPSDGADVIYVEADPEDVSTKVKKNQDVKMSGSSWDRIIQTGKLRAKNGKPSNVEAAEEDISVKNNWASNTSEVIDLTGIKRS